MGLYPAGKDHPETHPIRFQQRQQVQRIDDIVTVVLLCSLLINTRTILMQIDRRK